MTTLHHFPRGTHESLIKIETTIKEIEEKLDSQQKQLMEKRDFIADLMVQQVSEYDRRRRQMVEVAMEDEKKLAHNYDDLSRHLFKYRRKLRLLVVKGSTTTTTYTTTTTTTTTTSTTTITSTTTTTSTDRYLNSLLVRKEQILNFNVLLGEGPFGRVYKGQVNGTMVAIKELTHPIQGDKNVLDTTTLQEFERVVRLLSDISTPTTPTTTSHDCNVLRLLGACLDHHYYCLLTEVAENGSLHEVLHPIPRFGVFPVKLSFPRKMAMVRELVAGMKYLHSRQPPILHLDLKPSNILLDADWHVRIADFGMAKINAAHFLSTLTEFPPVAEGRTVDGSGGVIDTGALGRNRGEGDGGGSGKGAGVEGSPAVGTHKYMAPELLLQDRLEWDRVKPQTDVYSFAIVVNELLSEEIPYGHFEKGKEKLTLADLRSLVTRGEKQEENRPKLARAPLPLQHMLQSCWATAVLQRPTFMELDNSCPWENVLGVENSLTSIINLIYETVNHNNDISHHKEIPLRRLNVQWGGCSSTVQPPSPRTPRTGISNFDLEICKDTHSKAIEAILDINQQQQVTDEAAQRFCTWFTGVEEKDLCHVLEDICSRPWFCGNTQEAVIVEYLEKQRHVGAYLVHWSEKQSSPQFVLHYVIKDINKIRIKDHPLGATSIPKLYEAVSAILKGGRGGGRGGGGAAGTGAAGGNRELLLNSPASPRPPPWESFSVEREAFFKSLAGFNYLCSSSGEYKVPVNYVI